MKKLLLILTLVVPSILFAQQKTGNLTVFSEDGDKFILVLNGEKQNDIPQSNIRIEELPQPYYSAKVIFVDSTIAPISKNVQIIDLDNTMMDVTYRIKKDKSRKAKLSPYSSIAAQQDFVAPAGMYVHRFGQPSSGDGGAISQTTTTTTTNTVGANVNLPGVSMNITINDPTEEHITTHTSTTTSSSSHSSNSNTNDQTSYGGNCRGYAMKQGDFTAAKKTIADASFEDTKLTTAKSITSSNCLSSDQVVAICNLFSFEDTKLVFAKYAYRYTTDPKNYFKVNNVFSFDASKEELSKFITGE